MLSGCDDFDSCYVFDDCIVGFGGILFCYAGLRLGLVVCSMLVRVFG